jgi:hypothetical protein
MTDESTPTPARPAPGGGEPLYPCDDCGTMRTKAEGGTTFTVCDACWQKHYRRTPAPPASGEERVSCLCCGHVGEPVVWHGAHPEIYVCRSCRDAKDEVARLTRELAEAREDVAHVNEMRAVERGYMDNWRRRADMAQDAHRIVAELAAATAKQRDAARAEAAQLRVLARDHCSQCGQSFNAEPCGFAHAALQAERRALGGEADAPVARMDGTP